MFYTKVETYAFTVPKEYKAYLNFKDELKAAGIRFVETGGSTHQIIEVRTNGNFYMDDYGEIQINKGGN